ncbi:MAG: hypothetical protein HYU28_01410, partial [Actinobacteria bacterium]|nr:hypothetical protein [Actinomycetota bacterium]
GTGGGGTGGGGGGTGGTGGGGTGGGGSTATTAPTTTTTERPRSEVEVEIAVTDALGGDSHDFFEWLLGECADSSEPPGCEERRGKYFDTVEFHPQVRRYEETLDRLGFRGDSGTDLRRASDNVSLAIGVAHAVEALRGTKGTALSVMVPVLIKMQNNLRLALERGDEAEAASIGLAINRLFRLLTAMDRKADSVTKA